MFIYYSSELIAFILDHGRPHQIGMALVYSLQIRSFIKDGRGKGIYLADDNGLDFVIFSREDFGLRVATEKRSKDHHKSSTWDIEYPQ